MQKHCVKNKVHFYFFQGTLCIFLKAEVWGVGWSGAFVCSGVTQCQGGRMSVRLFSLGRIIKPFEIHHSLIYRLFTSGKTFKTAANPSRSAFNSRFSPDCAILGKENKKSSISRYRSLSKFVS